MKDNNKVSDEFILELGIELVAALKADLHKCSMEEGRIEALCDTEIDKLDLYTKEEFDRMPNGEHKNNIITFVNRNRNRLHEQAMSLGNAALNFLNRKNESNEKTN